MPAARGPGPDNDTAEEARAFSETRGYAVGKGRCSGTDPHDHRHQLQRPPGGNVAVNPPAAERGPRRPCTTRRWRTMTLPMEGGSNLTENCVGARFTPRVLWTLSRFQRHTMAGCGGAIKNILQHGGAAQDCSPRCWDGGQCNRKLFPDPAVGSMGAAVSALAGDLLILTVRAVHTRTMLGIRRQDTR